MERKTLDWFGKDNKTLDWKRWTIFLLDSLDVLFIGLKKRT